MDDDSHQPINCDDSSTENPLKTKEYECLCVMSGTIDDKSTVEDAYKIVRFVRDADG